MTATAELVRDSGDRDDPEHMMALGRVLAGAASDVIANPGRYKTEHLRWLLDAVVPELKEYTRKTESIGNVKTFIEDPAQTIRKALAARKEETDASLGAAATVIDRRTT